MTLERKVSAAAHMRLGFFLLAKGRFFPQFPLGVWWAYGRGRGQHVSSFERWREPGWRLQLFLQGAILCNLENLWPSTTSVMTAEASSDLEVIAGSTAVVGGRNT